MAMESINPATGETIATYDEHTPEQVNAALDRAIAGFEKLRTTSFAQRAAWMRAAGDVLRARKHEFGSLMTSEMGKPITEAEAEAEKCAWVCDYYAEHAETFLQPDPRQSNASESYVAFEPIGPVLAIMPWNFPFWQVFRFAAPALMAGNTGVLKHASNVSGCALAIEQIFREAGFPEGSFQTILVGSSRIADIIADDRIRAVTLTGSEGAGSAVGAAAGKAIKKSVLELGGSDPFIVLADADVDEAVRTAVRARNLNTGQSCIAAKRFIVEESIAEEFEQKLARAFDALRIGDPSDPETQVGSIARADLRDDLHDQVRRSVDQGAKVLAGGEAVAGPGAFYRPTVLAGIRPGMAAFDEETFGPVAAVIRAKDADEAITLANMNRYGLGSALWTRDIARAKQLARRIEAGSVFINGMVASDPRLPFGGVKKSGYGRELSEFGIREFVNVQTVWIGPAEDANLPQSE